MKFFDEKRGVVVGDRGTILVTADGGENWEKIQTNLPENLYALSFYDDKIGYAVGAKGTILRTKDGGKNWQDLEAPIKINLYDVLAYSESGAIAVGSLGGVIRTDDGGNSWKIQPNITSNSLQAIEYRGGNNLWVAGRGGSILKRTKSLSPIAITGPSIVPSLRPGFSNRKLPPRKPKIRIADDGDIPLASKPKPSN